MWITEPLCRLGFQLPKGPCMVFCASIARLWFHRLRRPTPTEGCRSQYEDDLNNSPTKDTLLRQRGLFTGVDWKLFKHCEFLGYRCLRARYRWRTAVLPRLQGYLRRALNNLHLYQAVEAIMNCRELRHSCLGIGSALSGHVVVRRTEVLDELRR